MNRKRQSIIIITILLVGSLAIFTLASAAVFTEKAYLPAVFLVTGTPPAAPSATPTATATPTPTATAVPRHFDNCAFQTGANATIAVPAAVVVKGDLELAVDDEIAVFTADGTICAGMTPWTGANIAVTAWGDDSQTEEVDGLRGGEEMMFRIWDRSAGREIPVQSVDYSLGDGFYNTDGIYIVQAFTLE